jgi:hypothetical protein
VCLKKGKYFQIHFRESLIWKRHLGELIPLVPLVDGCNRLTGSYLPQTQVFRLPLQLVNHTLSSFHVWNSSQLSLTSNKTCESVHYSPQLLVLKSFFQYPPCVLLPFLWWWTDTDGSWRTSLYMWQIWKVLPSTHKKASHGVFYSLKLILTLGVMKNNFNTLFNLKPYSCMKKLIFHLFFHMANVSDRALVL